MAKIYPTITETLNKSQFECRQFGNFHKSGKIPLYFQMYPDRMPIYCNDQYKSPVMLTIAQMVDLNDKGETFIICDPQDILTIHHYLSTYLDNITKYIEAIKDDADPAKRTVAKTRAFFNTIDERIAVAKKNAAKNKGIEFKEEQLSIRDILASLGA